MSRDIRSFFGATSKKTKGQKNIAIDSDEEIINKTPKKTSKNKKANVINSDSEEDKTPVKIKKQSPNLKPINVSDVFKNSSIKQSKVKEKLSSKDSVKTELGVHKDEDFDKTLQELDDDILLDNVDVLDKTIDEIKSNKKPKSEKRKKINEDDDSSTKKRKLDESYSDGQAAFENKRMMYERYLNRGGPKNHGKKTYPKGKKDSLKGLVFLRTGVLDSLLGEEFQDIVAKHGGRVVHAVSKKVNYLVVGEEPGPAKMAKAESYNIPFLSEDEFLDLILKKSDMNPKYVMESKKEEDSGVGTSQSTQEYDAIESPPVKIKKELTDEKPDIKETNIDKPTQADIKTKPIKYEDIPVSTKVCTKNKQNVPVYSCWTEKYKPKDLKQVIGQQRPDSELNKLFKWLQNWQENRKSDNKKSWDGSHNKCALLSGPPGVGKTTTATLVAQSLGFDIVEFNASDTRSQKLLREQVTELVKSRTIAGFAEGQKKVNMKRILLMDEVDGMAGNEDRGGMQGLIQIIKESNIPIICMCNDRYHQKIKSLVNYCFDLKLTPPKPEQIKGFLKSVCFKEKINVSYDALGDIVKNTGGDLRQALNYLSLWSVDHNEISDKTAKDVDRLLKDTIPGPWEVIRRVFTHKNHPSDPKPLSFIERQRLFFYDYSIGPLFVQENYLKVTPKMEFANILKPKHETLLRLAAATDAISFGALVETRIRSTNNWSLLDCQAMYSSVLPGSYLSGALSPNVNFPGWLGKNSKRSKLSRMLTEIHTHSKPRTCSSKIAIQLDYVTTFRNKIMRFLTSNLEYDIAYAVEFLNLYKLTKDDYDNLLQVMVWSGTKFPDIPAKVKSAFTRAYKKSSNLESRASFAKKAKKTEADDEGVEDNEDSSDDDIKNNPMIKVCVRKASDKVAEKPAKGKGKAKAKKK
ncbi:unnamed protein product [Brassicogethes aeneus]|uniref:Replication factor C subunit 1 n=1 Tax=Brassicogethes aeneus TaxID=1431903 RepID=A0A9P0B4G0_BRAAE|nr:unnamed protein product [Brassicogethes aeneus]